MLSITRGTDRPPVEGRRRSRVALGVSVAVNAAVIAAFFQALTHGYQWRDLFAPVASQPVAVEHIGFVQLPKAQGKPIVGRSGGDGRPVSRTKPAPAPPAPSTVPDAIPPANPSAPPTDAGGSGAVVGSGGALEGIRPSYGDSRIWAPAGKAVTAPRSAQGQIDSLVADVFTGVRDSMLAANAAAAGQRKPGDWTLKGPGGKWGMDQSAIRLGKIAIPNAVLALLSENLQKNLRGNPIQMAEDRRLASIRADLLQHAQREMNEDAFRQAVKEIRARKERERAVRVANDGKPVVADPAPVPAARQRQ
jgi:hypothetical protein